LRSGTTRSFGLNAAVVDAVLAVLLAGLALVSLVGQFSQMQLDPDEGLYFRQADLVGFVLILLGTLPLVWRRQVPLIALGLSSLVFVVFQSLGYATIELPFAPLLALYTTAAYRSLPVSASAAVVIALSLVAAAFAAPGPVFEDQLLANVLSVAVAWTLGYGVQLGRIRTALLEDRAAQLAREQAARTEQAVAQEKARIARELHDIVAHNVSVIVAQAGGATRVFHDRPEQAREALRSIETSGRVALTEMRRLLGVLRPDGSEGRHPPQPTLGDLPNLIDGIRRTGLPVEIMIEGEPRSLPAGLELNAYRIVQEALTNTLKHAGPSTARVRLRYQPDGLELEVCDDGRGGQPDRGTGQGLVGMRQRAALLDGTLCVGPGSAGGFRVAARLPIPGESR